MIVQITVQLYLKNEDGYKYNWKPLHFSLQKK